MSTRLTAIRHCVVELFMFPIQCNEPCKLQCRSKKKKNAKCQFMESAQTHTCGEFGIPVIRIHINK